MNKVAIVGFGRFGKTLYRLLKDDFEIVLFNRSNNAYKNFPLNSKTRIVHAVKEIYDAEVIFYAVPIASFESVIKSHKKYFKKHLLIDVLSVKMHASGVFKKHLKGTNARALLTHPMFGPDSSKNGFNGLRIVMDRFSANKKEYTEWKNYFSKKGLRVIEMSAKEHDRLAAFSQGLAHFMGRLLSEINFKETTIDTTGAKKLFEIMQQTTNDTWQLFLDLQRYNPYTKGMRLELGDAYDTLYNELLPKRIDPKKVIFGIQGGTGSFNEEALLDYVARHKIKNYEIKYLYTSEKVLRSLHEGTVDYGQFAIHNSIGGLVGESAYALSKYKVKIVEEFAIIIRHFLMKRKDVKVRDLKTIMAHPQVFAQCKTTLSKKYRKWKLFSGAGDLVDTAKAAKALQAGSISKNTAILGPINLSKLYDFDVIDKNLQDNKKNFTSFFMVSR